MRVKYITRDAGPEGVHEPGDICEVSEAEGRALTEGGYAVALDAPKKERKARTPEAGK